MKALIITLAIITSWVAIGYGVAYLSAGWEFYQHKLDFPTLTCREHMRHAVGGPHVMPLWWPLTLMIEVPRAWADGWGWEMPNCNPAEATR